MVGRASRTTKRQPEPPRICIGERFLDEVGIAIERTPGSGTISTLRYPAHNHSLGKAGDGLVLRVPPLLALQLFFEGTLDRKAGPVAVKYGGADLGRFTVTGVEEPRDAHSSRTAIIRFAKADAAPESASQDS